MFDSRSQVLINACGVPQGSVLGPLLFLLYINDLPEVTNHKCILFADDVSVVVPFRDNFEVYESDINNTIDKIVTWLNDNNLTVNINKTKYIQFGTNRQTKLELNIQYNGINIQEVTNTKFLGIIIDDNCDWKLHIGTLRDKINRYVFVLRRLRQTSNLQTSLAAYHGYIGSILKYGLLVWGNSTDLNLLFRAQKKCIRAICGMSPRQSCEPVFRSLKILPLPCMYILEVAMFVKNNIALFKKRNDDNSFNFRNPNKLVYNCLPRLGHYHKQCDAMCIKIFNAIHNDIKQLPNVIFKKKLVKWLRDMNFYKVSDIFNNK